MLILKLIEFIKVNSLELENILSREDSIFYLDT